MLTIEDIKRTKSNQLAVIGSMAAPSGIEFFKALHDFFQWMLPNAPESLWTLVMYGIAALMGGGLGKVARSLEN